MRADNVPLGVAVIIFTVLGLSLGDAIIKLTSSSFVIWQIFVLRSLMAIPCLVIVMAIKARSSLHPPTALIWTTVRSLLLVSMWVSYYISLPQLSMSAAAATFYTLPIFITLFSAIINAESVGRTGWIAVILGFAGVLLILNPSVSDFNWFALLPLLSAILYAAAMLLTRTKCRLEHPLMLSLALNVAFVIVGVCVSAVLMFMPTEAKQGFVLAPWTSMGLEQWLSMSLLAIAILIGSIGTAIAYQIAPSSVIGVFDFAYVGFAVLWGVLFFADTPQIDAIAGIGLIVLAGVLSLRS